MKTVSDVEGEESRRLLEAVGIKLREYLVSKDEYICYLDNLPREEDKFLTRPQQSLGGRDSWLAVLTKAMEAEIDLAKSPETR